MSETGRNCRRRNNLWFGDVSGWVSGTIFDTTSSMRREGVPARAYLHARMNAGMAANLFQSSQAICPSARQEEPGRRVLGLVSTSRSNPGSMSRSRRVVSPRRHTGHLNDLSGVTRRTLRSRPHVKLGLTSPILTRLSTTTIPHSSLPAPFFDTITAGLDVRSYMRIH